ncbi:MAG: sorbosone dehydrogenase family protein [Sphingomonadales bacterium]|nr:sorbosone dehydrogenase family protein [Sphingomonadales bacterium]MBD3774427.1 sorbosone dehydrogenase family protein [Paracoccaceae bacterium]
MSTLRKILIALLVILVLLAGFGWYMTRGQTAELTMDQVSGTDPKLADPSPENFPTVGIADPVGWGADQVPAAAQGLAVTRFADGLDHPRVVYTLPNGDVLVALTNRPPASDPGGITGWFMRTFLDKAGAGDASPNQIVLLRDANGDGKADVKQVLRSDLSSPSGMAWRDGTLYVADHDALLAFKYQPGEMAISGTPEKLMDLPPAGNHWMRNIIISPDGKQIYVAVGSSSNIGENGMDKEEGRAAIWEYDIAKKRQRLYASGLRNPNGLAWSPMSGELWTTVNERDMLGGDLVPDYLTNVPVGAQYGWPWVYWGDTFDRRVEAPVPAYLTEYARKPEFALGPHVAALGLVFTQGGSMLGEKFSHGAIIARHGSWNRKPPSGYDVVYVAFDDLGNPVGKPVPLLTGFLEDGGKTHGRPTWVAWAGDGALLVSDDTAGIIWRVVAPGAAPAQAMKPLTGTSLPPRTELNGDSQAAFGPEDYARVEPVN